MDLRRPPQRGVPGTAGRLRRAGRAWHSGSITPSGASLAQRVDYAERGVPGTAGRLLHN
ncbi:hypothetical protein LRD18_11280 [Halorhodospira halochloris]|uniref:hypothetical protein n=1 Tax=Halorhodospira halochloris TaxID=1052 RepID=UPI001EE8BE45|nr:hypothetical protein [Halorhodospira halochloris]MCG5531427.1 hypothetical protein [Halorhodospira halochloris]